MRITSIQLAKKRIFPITSLAVQRYTAIEDRGFEIVNRYSGIYIAKNHTIPRISTGSGYLEYARFERPFELRNNQAGIVAALAADKFAP